VGVLRSFAVRGKAPEAWRTGNRHAQHAAGNGGDLVFSMKGINMSQKRKRFFCDEFKRGDKVSIIRARHGWFDGGTGGTIVEISDMVCVVLCTFGHHKGSRVSIKHPRDIRRMPNRS
jgi:hypothetical protein